MDAATSSQCLTSLVPPETTPHALRTQSYAQLRVHHHTWNDRAQVISAFEGSADPALLRRAEKMGLCCVTPCLCVERGRVPVVSPGRCRDRLCPLCCRVRGAKARERLRGLVLKADSVRLITLTRKYTEQPLCTELELLQEAWQKLRRTKGWKTRVRGGLFVIEITRGSDGAIWHVHLHVLAEGSYYDQKQLTADWSAAVGSPSITDIRATHSRVQAASYVTKYVTKGADLKDWPEHTIVEYAVGVHRKRLFGTFGKWHRADVNSDADEEPKACPSTPVSMHLVLNAMEQGCLPVAETAKLLSRLGFVACRMLAGAAVPPDPNAEPLNAASFASLTAFCLELAHAPPSIDEQRLAARTADDARNGGRFTAPLWRDTRV